MARRTISLPALVIILAIGIGSCTGNGSLRVGSTKTPAFFIFDDSSVDPGNNNYIHAVGGNPANKLPYGLNGFFGKPTGRFSDGRIIFDFIGKVTNHEYFHQEHNSSKITVGYLCRSSK